jgi:arginyl-tRNA synthetase
VASLEGVEGVDVAGPGFLNITVDGPWLGRALAAVVEQGRRFGGGSAETPERIQVELVSANPTGPITVASARNGAYGDAVARLLEFAGNDVEREYYYNDAGAQMDLFRASVDAVRRGEEPPEDGYRGEYVAVLAREEGDPIARMLAQIEGALERFRIHFDSFERQSVVEGEIPEGRVTRMLPPLARFFSMSCTMHSLLRVTGVGPAIGVNGSASRACLQNRALETKPQAARNSHAAILPSGASSVVQ